METVSLLASVLRRWPRFGRWGNRERIQRLPFLGFEPVAWRQIGPMRIGLDVRDKYQYEMLLGEYEPLATEFLSRALPPGGTYVDVGAQLGFTAAFAAQAVGPSGRLILFEPDPRALKRLRRHLQTAKRNQLPEVHTVAAGCSSKPGELRFHESPILGHSRVVSKNEKIPECQITRVPVLQCDHVLRKLGVRNIDFLKVDVEGHEKHALAGLQQTLSRGSAHSILVEKNHFLQGDPVRETLQIHAMIARHGYEGFHEADRRPITRESLLSKSIPLENLFYSRNKKLIRSFIGGEPRVAETKFCSREIQNLANDAIQCLSLEEEIREIILLAKNGAVPEAIVRGERFLTGEPETDWLRGHVAHWQLAVGNVERAGYHYRLLHEKMPDEPGICRVLEEIESTRSLYSQPHSIPEAHDCLIPLGSSRN